MARDGRGVVDGDDSRSFVRTRDGADHIGPAIGDTGRWQGGLTRLDRRAVGMLAGTVVLVAVMVPLAAGREEAFDTALYATLPLVLGVVGR